MKNIFKLMCSTLAALCLGVFTSCDLLGDLNPDFKFKEEYEVLMGKWTCETYLEGEPYTLQFTFNKNGKVKVREIFEGDDFSTDMLFNIEGDLSEGADVSIYGGKGMDGESVELNFIVTVNGDEAIFINEERGELIFKRESDDEDPDVDFEEEHEVLMGKWTYISYSDDGEVHRKQFTFNKNGKVNVYDDLGHNELDTDRLYKIDAFYHIGESAIAYVSIYGEMDGKPVKQTYQITVNGDEATFEEEGESGLVFKRGAGDMNPDFTFEEKYKSLMGKWTYNLYSDDGELYTRQFTFYKNGIVRVLEGEGSCVYMFYNIEGDLGEEAYVTIYEGPAEGWTFAVTVNGDEAIFKEGESGLVFKRGAGDGNPDFEFREEHEVLMGKWIYETYSDGEPLTLQLTFYKNGKVNVRENFKGENYSSDMLFNTGDWWGGGDSYTGRVYLKGDQTEYNFYVRVNGDEAEFEGWLPGSGDVLLVFKRG